MKNKIKNVLIGALALIVVLGIFLFAALTQDCVLSLSGIIC